jgi:thiol-disulfide isomerase/thioredoxin
VSRFVFISLILLGLTACFEKPVAPVRNISPIPAPEFSLATLSGPTLESSSLKGQIVVLNFWATWTPASSKEIPDLINLQKKYQDKVRIISIALGESTRADAQKISEEVGVNYPVAIAPAEFHQNFGGIDAIPSSFIIDQNWNLINRYTGRIRPEEISAELDYMLSEKAKP